jgi:hypothetical protein
MTLNPIRLNVLIYEENYFLFYECDNNILIATKILTAHTRFLKSLLWWAI